MRLANKYLFRWKEQSEKDKNKNCYLTKKQGQIHFKMFIT